MIVCSCRAIGDGAIRDAISHGASSIEDVARTCGAGGRCRGCWPSVQALLDECGGGACDAAACGFERAEAHEGRRGQRVELSHA